MKKPSGNQQGFTLIEVSVAVLVIAVLLAIAVPTFLGFRRFSQDRVAQSHLRTALASAKVLLTDSEDYRDATATALQDAETSLRFVPADQPSSGPATVSVNPVSSAQWVAVARSDTGACFALVGAITGAGTRYARSSDDPCEADEPWAVGASDAGW